MKKLGIFLILFGLLILAFIGFSFFEEKNKMVSPLPEEKGVKVIFISPTK